MAKKPFRCNSSACESSGNGKNVLFLEPKQPCPACGSSRCLSPLETIHLVIPEEDGPVKGKETDWNFACEEAKSAKVRPIHFTVVRDACTCESCLQATA